MTIEKARELLGVEYEKLSDEAILDLIQLIRSVCTLVIGTEKSDPNTSAD